MGMLLAAVESKVYEPSYLCVFIFRRIFNVAQWLTEFSCQFDSFSLFLLFDCHVGSSPKLTERKEETMEKRRVFLHVFHRR